MKTLSEVTALIGRVDRVELRAWVQRGWIASREVVGAEPTFSEVDIARARLICDLHHDLAVDEETIPMVLSLLDQIYALRRQMTALTGAIQQQPEDVRQAILDLVTRRTGGNPG
jgi:chaperone modulatory protein CbpM